MAPINRVLNAANQRRVTNRNNAGKNSNGAPQFPGAQNGLTVDQIREIIQNQPRQFGLTTQVAAGNNPIQGIKLPGDSRLLLGINWNSVQVTAATDTYNFSVNNNKIVQNVPALLNSTGIGSNGITFAEKPYVPLMQPLSGQDTFEMDYTAGAPGTVQFVIWYI